MKDKIIIDGKDVEFSTIDIDGVDTRDYPDFADAYFCYAEFTDGTQLSEEQLYEMAIVYDTMLYEMIINRLH